MRKTCWLLVAAFLSLGVAPASASALSETFSEYQTASQAGDFRAARTASRRAFQIARGEYGEYGLQTMQLAAVHAATLNTLLEYEAAIDFLLPYVGRIINAGDFERPEAPYQVHLQFARGLRGMGDRITSSQHFRTALDLAASNHGPDSLEAGLAHLELARTRWGYAVVQGDALRGRVIGTGLPVQSGSIESLEAARRILAETGDQAINLALLDVFAAGNMIATGDRDGAGPLLTDAINQLAALGYMDDYILQLYIDWVAGYLGDWPVKRLENALNQAIDLGHLRIEGDALPIVRVMDFRHSRARADYDFTGDISVEFQVNEEGLIRRTRVIDTDRPGYWDDEIRDLIRGWVYMAAQERGEPVSKEGLIANIHVSTR